jgi:hypothetical protein
MLNTRKFEELVRETETLSREFHQALFLREEIKRQVGLRVLNGEELELEGFKNNLEDAEFTVRWSKERLEEVKTELVNMVNSLSLSE